MNRLFFFAMAMAMAAPGIHSASAALLDMNAIGAIATQSSTYTPGPYDASVAIDGNADGTVFTHTNEPNNTSPWWQVDLQGMYEISQAVLYNRASTNPAVTGRLSDLTVEILDESSAVVWTSAVINPGNIDNGPASISVSIPDVVGHTLRISRPAVADVAQILTLAEVQIDAVAVPEPNACVLLLSGMAGLGWFRKRK